MSAFNTSMFESIKDALVSENKSQSNFNDIISCKVGNTYTVRLLPFSKSPKDTFFHYYNHGWVSFATGQYVQALSPQTFGERDPIAEEPEAPKPRALVEALDLLDRVLLRVEPAQLGQRPQAPQVREPLVRDAQALQRLRDGPQAPDGLEAAVDEAQPPQPRAAAQTAPVPVVVVAAERDDLERREDDLELVEAVVLLDAHARRLLDERARDALLLGRLRGAHG